MLTVRAAERLDVLARELAVALDEPPDDPMQPDLVVAPTAGVQRWLSLELARHLGASAPERTDGIAANIEMWFPGRLARAALYPDTDDATHPWDLELVAWTLFEMLRTEIEGSDDDRFGPLRRTVDGLPTWARARRIADLFDRYLSHRPEMVQAWARGRDVDGGGHRLADEHTWQPFVWRALREAIGVPSPPELLGERLDAIRSGEVSPDIPSRIGLFGLTNVPGGAPFVAILDALSAHRDVLLLAHQPSDELAAIVVDRVGSNGWNVHRRADDPTIGTADHPLLRTWGRPAREAGAVLAAALGERATGTAIDTAADIASTSAPTVLAALQSDIRANRPPRGAHVPTEADSSIRVHSCHGLTRQIEVLRDQVLHLLAADDTLREEDIVVMSPSLDDVVTAMAAVLGPPAPPIPPAPGADPVAGPVLRYRVADRSIRSNYASLTALGALLELLSSRCSGAALLEFASLTPVRAKFGFDDDALATLDTWIDRANTTWGLDGEHRTRWGLPADFDAGTWSSLLDQLLLGAATTDDPAALGPDGTLPLPVEGFDLDVLGRLAALVALLTELVDRARADRPLDAWCQLLADAADRLFAFPIDQQWQTERLTRTLHEIRDLPLSAATGTAVDLTLADVRHLVGQRLAGTAGRSDFFRGGMTVSSLTPLRGVPARVVMLVGVDDAAFSAPTADGDDLTAAEPLVGDRDRRSDTRQAMLDALLAAADHFMVFRSGHHEITNQEIPPAVAVAELCDVVEATVDGASRRRFAEQLVVAHPRHRFDAENYRASPVSDTDPLERPWSFDGTAVAGARARVEARPTQPLLTGPLVPATPDVIDLADLEAFIAHPVRYFLQRVLQVGLPRATASTGRRAAGSTPTPYGLSTPPDGRNVPFDLDNLAAWGIRDRLLQHHVRGGTTESFVARERASGSLPPGARGDTALRTAIDAVDPFLHALGTLGVRPPARAPRSLPIDVTLDDGTRIVGALRDDGGERAGPVEVTVSARKDAAVLRTWIRAAALAAAHPELRPRAVHVHGAGRGEVGATAIDLGRDDPDEMSATAIESLTVAVDLFVRGVCEPLPVLPRVSRAVHEDRSPRSGWTSFQGSGDRDDQWIALAFDHPDLDELLAVPATDADPPGAAPTRVARYAHHLWGHVLTTAPPQTLEVT